MYHFCQKKHNNLFQNCNLFILTQQMFTSIWRVTELQFFEKGKKKKKTPTDFLDDGRENIDFQSDVVEKQKHIYSTSIRTSGLNLICASSLSGDLIFLLMKFHFSFNGILFSGKVWLNELEKKRKHCFAFGV